MKSLRVVNVNRCGKKALGSKSLVRLTYDIFHIMLRQAMRGEGKPMLIERGSRIEILTSLCGGEVILIPCDLAKRDFILDKILNHPLSKRSSAIHATACAHGLCSYFEELSKKHGDELSVEDCLSKFEAILSADRKRLPNYLS